MILFEYCFKHNIFYDNDIVDNLAKSPSYIGAQNRSQIYIDTLKANPKYKGDTFFDQLRRDNFKKIYSESLSASGLTEEDKMVDTISKSLFSTSFECTQPK